MKEVISNIKGMMREYKNTNNTDRVREYYKKELTNIFNTIDRELHLRHAQVDGYEVGSKEDYEQ